MNSRSLVRLVSEASQSSGIKESLGGPTLGMRSDGVRVRAASITSPTILRYLPGANMNTA